MMYPIVQILERQTQAAAQSPADGGFAGAHKAHENHGAYTVSR
jgi:hypothetical protein